MIIPSRVPWQDSGYYTLILQGGLGDPGSSQVPSFAEAKSFAVAPAQAPVRCGRMASLVVRNPEGLPFRGRTRAIQRETHPGAYMTPLCIIVCICICVGQKVSMKKNPTFESDIYIYQSIMKHRNP